MCPRTVKLLYYMYMIQSCCVTLSNNCSEHVIYLMTLGNIMSYRHYFTVYTLIICFQDFGLLVLVATLF